MVTLVRVSTTSLFTSKSMFQEVKTHIGLRNDIFKD